MIRARILSRVAGPAAPFPPMLARLRCAGVGAPQGASPAPVKGGLALFSPITLLGDEEAAVDDGLLGALGLVEFREASGGGGGGIVEGGAEVFT